MFNSQILLIISLDLSMYPGVSFLFSFQLNHYNSIIVVVICLMYKNADN